jgi:hypothetical protein
VAASIHAPDIGTDAIAVLKADHRVVEHLLAAHRHARDPARGARLARRLCAELRIHMALVEELFYPALAGRIDARLLRRGRIAHDGARRLIGEIERGADPGRDARLPRLAARVRRRFRADEAPARGLFARCRAAGIDLVALGGRMLRRREELALAADRDGRLPADPPPRRR